MRSCDLEYSILYEVMWPWVQHSIWDHVTLSTAFYMRSCDLEYSILYEIMWPWVQHSTGGHVTLNAAFYRRPCDYFSIKIMSPPNPSTPQAGYGQTLLMIVLGYGVVVLTVLSISAIATSATVEGGGVYCILPVTWQSHDLPRGQQWKWVIILCSVE